MGRKGCAGGMVSQVRCAHRNSTQWVARAVLWAVLGVVHDLQDSTGDAAVLEKG